MGVPDLRPRQWVWVGCGLALLVAVAVSPFTGRSELDGGYRPLMSADGLTSGCYPLPGGVELPFAYVLRTDADVASPEGPRRRVVLHYDLIDGATARTEALTAFAAAGVADQVSITVQDFDVPTDSIVRGQMTLDLPQQPLASNAPACADPYSTKRFPDWFVDES